MIKYVNFFKKEYLYKAGKMARLKKEKSHHQLGPSFQTCEPTGNIPHPNHNSMHAFKFLLGVCVGHSTCMEARRQHLWSWLWLSTTCLLEIKPRSFVRLGGKHLYPLSHLPSPAVFPFFFLETGLFQVQ